MSKVVWISVAVALWAFSGCSSKEHAAFLTTADPHVSMTTASKKGTGGIGGADAGFHTGGRFVGTGGIETGGGSSTIPKPGNGIPQANWEVLSPPFDPKTVYLFGTLQPGLCGREALAPVSNPNQFAIGFSCDVMPSSGVISGGKLLFIDGTPHSIYELSPDALGADINDYPRDALANDRQIKTNCGSVSVRSFVVSPSGRLLYSCGSSSNGDWFDESGNTVYSSSSAPLTALAEGDLAATTGSVLNLKDGIHHDVTQLERMISISVHGNGFHFAATVDLDHPLEPELWSVDAQGNATKLGTYPPPPDGVQTVAPTVYVLAEDDSLLTSAVDKANVVNDTVYRRTIDGADEIVYTEADKPYVQMHASALITGPGQ